MFYGMASTLKILSLNCEFTNTQINFTPNPLDNILMF